MQAISIPHNLLNYTHFWLTFITHNITICTPRISWSLILSCCKNPLISRVTKVLNDAAPESHWKNQKFPTAEKYCPIRNVPPSNWTTLGRRTPSAKVQHSVVVAQHRDNCFSMRPLHYCCRCCLAERRTQTKTEKRGTKSAPQYNQLYSWDFSLLPEI